MLLVAFMSGGCATIWQEQRENFLERSYAEYEAAESCCNSYRGFEYEDFAGSGVTFELGEGSPAYAFSYGKSFFSAFRIPAAARGRRIRVKSMFVPGGMGGMIPASAMFLPVITFLAEDFSVKSTKVAMPETDHAGWLTDLEGGGVAFMDIPKESAYMVVHTEPERFDQAFAFSRTDSGNFVGDVYVTSGTHQFAVPFSPTGKVFIRYAEPGE
ncbi:hypothetical protein [Algiphilus aromaticivorans]|uniref:hypothetical protein n=1 Tax=Algiphilus aromaticivorans TaxID=382454 RepID=UPI0012EBDFD0|nr:hypothetical protein [Algiphilus aromaticivorans]